MAQRMNLRTTGCCPLVVMAGVPFALPLPLLSAGGTVRVASKRKPVAAADGWPEGALALVNDPLRTDGWKPWFSELPNDVTHYHFGVHDAEDVNRVVQRLAEVKSDVVRLRLHAGQHRAARPFRRPCEEEARDKSISRNISRFVSEHRQRQPITDDGESDTRVPADIAR